MSVMKCPEKRVILILGAAVFLAACGGPPKDNPLLDEARTAFTIAARDSAIVTHAPAALDNAEATLRRGEALLAQGTRKEEIDHQAYVAQQYVAIAEASAGLKAAEDEIGRAELERTEVMMRMREAEAEAARREADAREREAAAARAEADAERARAEELAEELEARRTQRGLVLTLPGVLFDVGRATLQEGGLRAVDRLAAFMTENPERRVLVEGHTDATGSASYNIELSRLRAEAIKAAMMARGVEEHRIRTIGFGQSYPVASNATTSGRQQNRRVEIIVSDDQGHIPERD